MALIRRSGARFSANIWPGFVDAMTAILLILMFVLSIFMIVQSILRDTITGQNSELVSLNADLNQTKNDLGFERSKLAQLDAQYEEKLIALSTLEKNLKFQRLNALNLNQTLKEKNSKLDILGLDFKDLTLELGLLTEQLSNQTEEFLSLQKKHTGAQMKLTTITADSEERIALLSALRAKYIISEGKAANFETEMTKLIAKNNNFSQSLEISRNKIEKNLKQTELLKSQLVLARKETDKSFEDARLAAAKSEALEVLILSLKNDKKNLNQLKNSLNEELINKDNELVEIEKNKLLEQAAIASLRKKLSQEHEELGLLTLTLEAERLKALETLSWLASARAVQEILKEKNKNLDLQKTSTQEQLEAKKVALKEARAQLLEEKDLTKVSALEIARLKFASDSLNQNLSELKSILDESDLKDSEKSVEIKLLGGRLNTALARVASEQRKRAELEAREVKRLKLEANDLKNYRSEFFGRLRTILGEKPGIEIVGDRFVFSSEVLFQPGSAVLGDDGKSQLSQVASVVREVGADIPPTINWILRVDGHTDRTPLAKTSKFLDNWELSQARSLSVVKYLIKYEKLEAKRLAAAGFGAFQPLSSDQSPSALARNRRIELKFTEK